MKIKNLALLGLLALLWGPSFLFIKVAVAEIPPISLVVGRVGLAFLLLYGLLRLRGGRLPAWGTTWRHLAIVALFHNSLPFVLLSWGEQHIDSALASIVNGGTPIFTILLAHFMTSDDKLTRFKALGVFLGMSGLVLLAAPTLVAGVQATTLGLLAVVLVSASYGLAIVYTRKHLRSLPSLVAPTTQMLLATVYLLPLALLIDRPFSLPAPSLEATASLLALGLLGTTLAFVVYYRLLESATASYASMVTYLIPVVGVILGVLVLDEQLTWNAYAGFALILMGVMVVNGTLQDLRRRWPTVAPVKRHPKPLDDSVSPR